MVGFIDIYAELRQAGNALEPGVDSQIGVGLGRGFAKHLVKLAIDFRQRAGLFGEQLVGRSRLGRAALQDDLLGVRDDDVER